MTQAPKIISLEDFMSMPEAERGERAEFIAGQIVQKALPGGQHGELEATVGTPLVNLFRRKRRDDGTGGWWIKYETSVLYPGVQEIHTHDIVGWRRERVPETPLDYPVRERPDWVCEISVSTLRKDTGSLKQTLELEQVPFYWVVDSANKQILVFEHIDGHLVQTRNLFPEDGLQRIPPFEAAEISVGVLFGEEID